MFATGIMLYLGYGGWWVYLHSTAAFVGLAYIFVHIVAHYMHGGWWQLLRIFNPTRLVITRAVRPKPLLIGSIVGLGVVAAIAATDLNDARSAHHRAHVRAGAQARRRAGRRDLEKRGAGHGRNASGQQGCRRRIVDRAGLGRA